MRKKSSVDVRKKPRATTRRRSAGKEKTAPVHWRLRLYIAGQTPKSLSALANLNKLCEQNLAGQYQIEVIDLLKEPHRAKGDEIIALPTLVRKLPEPIKRVIGDLSNFERVMVAIELHALQQKSTAAR